MRCIRLYKFINLDLKLFFHVSYLKKLLSIVHFQGVSFILG